MGALAIYYQSLDTAQRVACVDAILDVSDFVSYMRVKRLAREKQAAELGITYKQLVDQANETVFKKVNAENGSIP